MTPCPYPVMIFAAGFGTRMRDLTRDRPKPMIPLAGQSLIDRALELVDQVAPPHIMVNTHYKAEVLERHLADRDLQISREDPDILDTGGGLKQALLRKNVSIVVTMNPDVVWSGSNPIDLILQHWNPDHMDALLACVPLNRVLGRVGGGDFALDDTGRVSRSGNYVYGGVQIMKTERLADMSQGVFSLNAVWDQMLVENRLYACEYPGRWCDVGSPEGLALAEKLVAGDV